ncbi:Spaf_1101 family AAA-like ATPase [Lactiplantibacillus herbarum]|uniref:Spaf_1101 family AAA-like ATPase n=1 Tax=Lactiplantibacillus herbarum TaxID=1670446 RepID=UPI00064E4BFC|nr:AAA family ATPase [Lactiplantibacillus herbarum]
MKPKLRKFRKITEESSLFREIKHLNGLKQSYGKYRKTLLHFHTPASHDYTVIPDTHKKEYSSYTIDEIVEIANERDLFRFPKFQKDDYLSSMVENNELFSDYKELLVYLLIGDTLFREQIELAIITDHNTIDGYKKLKDAVNILRRAYGTDMSYPHIQLGAEISCGDAMHVVAILDDSMIEKFNAFLEPVLVTEQRGTYLPSWKVMDAIKKIGGIAYIAHFNTVNILKTKGIGKAYSGAYKDRLLSPDNMKIVGLSDLSKTEGLKNKFRQDRNINDVTILYDEDSHELEALGKKFFWLKGQELNFRMIVNAIHDADISVRQVKPKLPSAYIKSIHVEGTGFLGNNADFDVPFSTALNCVIGGRGSGKSTLLDCIGFVLSRKIGSVSQLENICNQGKIELSVSYQDQDYYIYFRPAIDGYNPEMFIRSYLYGTDRATQYSERKEVPNWSDITEKTTEKIQIFTVQGTMIYEVINKQEFLDTMFKAVYSINELVKYATDDRITNFIGDQFALNNEFIKKIRINRVKDDEQLEKECNKIDSRLNDRQKNIQEAVEPFNKITKNLRILYTQQPILQYEFGWLDNINPDYFHGGSGWFDNFNITEESLYDYLNDLTDEIILPKVYLLFKKGQWPRVNEILDIKKYADKREFHDIENGVVEITKENEERVLSQIYYEIFRPARGRIYSFLQSYYLNVDVFDLEFDINSYENESDITKFKLIQQVSLGQKVVALLDFIFAYGSLNGDTTPLLLDQPEDNLDSSYIYQHLVTSLRKVKDRRQAIVVTHNSTIVTNSKPEEIISMKSDNLHGWVDNSGYPTEVEVIKRIINLLEGGYDSFEHKEFIYDPVLKNAK